MVNVNVNLQPVFAVQLSSGWESELFPSLELAEARREAHNKAVMKAFEDGDRSLGYSIIESDLNGGCYQNWHINPASLAGCVYENPPFSMKAEVW